MGKILYIYSDILSKFCKPCLSKSVNNTHTVEDIILIALKTGESNDIRGVFGGCMALQSALAALKEQGGCQSCIGGVQSTVDALQSFLSGTDPS